MLLRGALIADSHRQRQLHECRRQLICYSWSLLAYYNAYAACHPVTKVTSTEGSMACDRRYLISQQPEADCKIAEELDSLDLLVTCTRRTPRQLQYADLSRMPYLSGAIRVGSIRAVLRSWMPAEMASNEKLAQQLQGTLPMLCPAAQGSTARLCIAVMAWSPAIAVLHSQACSIAACRSRCA